MILLFPLLLFDFLSLLIFSPLTLVLLALSIFSHSPFTTSLHPLHFGDYHGRTETQATALILSLLHPTTASSADA